MLGPVDVAYALAVAEVDPYAMADDVLVPLQVSGSSAGATGPTGAPS